MEIIGSKQSPPAIQLKYRYCTGRSQEQQALVAWRKKTERAWVEVGKVRCKQDRENEHQHIDGYDGGNELVLIIKTLE